MARSPAAQGDDGNTAEISRRPPRLAELLVHGDPPNMLTLSVTAGISPASPPGLFTNAGACAAGVPEPVNIRIRACPRGRILQKLHAAWILIPLILAAAAPDMAVIRRRRDYPMGVDSSALGVRMDCLRLDMKDSTICLPAMENDVILEACGRPCAEGHRPRLCCRNADLLFSKAISGLLPSLVWHFFLRQAL